MTSSKWVLECVRKWGGPAADAILEPSCEIFTVSTVDGLIGYREENGCAVVFGDTVSAPENWEILTRAFHNNAKNKGWKVIYIMASQSFAKWALENVCKVSIEFANEVTLNPQQDPRANHGKHAHLVRRKVRHAEKEGTSVKEYLTNDSSLEKEIEEVADKWLNLRKGLQLFISHVRLFENRNGKRWFYALKEGRVVGVVVLNRMESHQGWLLNRLLITPDAPHGTSEMLVVNALEACAKDGCQFVSFGLALSGVLGEIKGLGKISSTLSRWIFALVNKFFNITGTAGYWDKYDPKSTPSYLLFSHAHIGWREIRSILKATNMTRY